MVGQETLSITANKRNCLTMLYLDNCVMGIGSIRLFATVGYHNQIELTFAIKDTNKESIINDGGNRIATKMAVGK